MTRGVAPRVAAILLCMAAFAPRADAQRLAPEARLDAFLAREHALNAGAGASLRIARSVAIGALAMAALVRDDGAERGRLELVGRFLFDPDRRGATGVYAAGGVAARWREGSRVNGVLTVTLGAELGRGSLVPFVEGGLGGGVRLAAGVRHR